MTLSRTARAIAAEISVQDWSDAHTRADGSRHDRKLDRTSANQLSPDEASFVKMNVVWVVGQALAETDAIFDIREFAQASGVDDSWLLTKRGTPNGGIEAGLRPPQNVELSQQGPLWVATRNSRPNGTVSTAVGASPQDALQALLDSDWV
jgi:hypothetical protein